MLRKETIVIGSKEELLEHFRAGGKKDVSSTLTIEGQLDLLLSARAVFNPLCAGMVFFLDKAPAQTVDGMPTEDLWFTSGFVVVYTNEEAERRGKLWGKLNAQNHMG